MSRKAKRQRVRAVRDYFLAHVLSGFLWVATRLPYATRLRVLPALASRLFARPAGYAAVIRRNLALVCPELPPQEVRRLEHAVPANTLRTLLEIFSGQEFKHVAARARLQGKAGLAALEEANAAGRGVILVSGHFGNYDVARAVLSQRGMRVGGLYRPMSNRHFNARYVDAISRIAQPVFPRGRRGLAGMVRFLRGGGMIGLLIDQRMNHGAPLTFFGHTAYTALSAAQMALKYDVLLVPAYGVRRENSIDFDLVIEPPVPPGTPEEMTQALNDSLEAQVRRNMDQWMWLHDRWRAPGRHRRKQTDGTIRPARPDNR